MWDASEAMRRAAASCIADIKPSSVDVLDSEATSTNLHALVLGKMTTNSKLLRSVELQLVAKAAWVKGHGYYGGAAAHLAHRRRASCASDALAAVAAAHWARLRKLKH